MLKRDLAALAAALAAFLCVAAAAATTVEKGVVVMRGPASVTAERSFERNVHVWRGARAATGDAIAPPAHSAVTQAATKTKVVVISCGRGLERLRTQGFYSGHPGGQSRRFTQGFFSGAADYGRPCVRVASGASSR